MADRDAVTAAFDALDAAWDEVAALPFDALTSPEVLMAMDRLETLDRRQPALRNRLINQLAQQTCPAELGGKNMADVLVQRLRISRAEARRRVAEAEDLGPRAAMTGEPLAPRLPETAAAQEAGQVGTDHVRIIRR